MWAVLEVGIRLNKGLRHIAVCSASKCVGSSSDDNGDIVLLSVFKAMRMVVAERQERCRGRLFDAARVRGGRVAGAY